MCGRFTQRKPAKVIEEHFGVEVPPTQPSFNVAPTHNVLAIRSGDGGRDAAWLFWGLVPAWAKDASAGSRFINARSETVAQKPSFREPFKRRRCIIPADGFYEWQKTGGGKQPYFFRMKDNRLFGFAGLWDRWEGKGGVVLDSCTILTTKTNEVLRPVHDRMPVILHPEEYSLWLEAGEHERTLLMGLLRPYPAEEMVGYPVSTLVNSPGNRGAELIAKASLNSA
jgi:putative SOS response-associated peptidase YedK